MGDVVFKGSNELGKAVGVVSASTFGKEDDEKKKEKKKVVFKAGVELATNV